MFIHGARHDGTNHFTPTTQETIGSLIRVQGQAGLHGEFQVDQENTVRYCLTHTTTTTTTTTTIITPNKLVRLLVLAIA